MMVIDLFVFFFFLRTKSRNGKQELHNCFLEIYIYLYMLSFVCSFLVFKLRKLFVHVKILTLY